MKTVLFSGYYGFGNLGDEALLAATVQLLRDREDPPHVVVLSADPAQTHADHGVEAVPRWSLARAAAAIRRCDLFASGGGGLMQDATSWASPLYYLGLIALARACGKPYVAYAQGIGPLRRPLSVALARQAFRRARAITVRDAESAEWLRSRGISGNVTLTADPALALRPAPEEAVDALLAQEGIAVGEDTVIVALREWGEVVNFAARAAVEVREIARRLGVRPLLVPMHHPGDIPLAKTVAQEAGEPAVVLLRRLKPSEGLGVIRRAGAVLGMRLHALVLGVAAERPVLGIGYDPKVAAFLESAGGPAALDIAQMGSGQVAAALGALWQRRDADRRRLAARLPELRERAERNVAVLLAALDQ
jgi:polysaccharide pyruvyl transferase CsaB